MPGRALRGRARRERALPGLAPGFYTASMQLWRWRVLSERAKRCALPLFVLRALEGLLAGWTLAVGSPAVSENAWVAAAALSIYLAANAAVCLAYRRGRTSAWLVAADIAVNGCVVALSVATSGAERSALLPLLPLKVIPYALVFGAPAGLAFFCTGAALAVLIRWIAPAELLAAAASSVAFSAAQLTALAAAQAGIGGALAAVWLRWVLEDRVPRQAPDAARDRAAAAALRTNALLAMSSALAPLTRGDEIVAKAIEIAPAAMNADGCSIALWTADGTYHVRGTWPGNMQSDDEPPRLSSQQVADFEWVRRLGRCALAPASASGEVLGQGALIAPLSSGTRFHGVLTLVGRGGRAMIAPHDMSAAAALAAQIATALERARLVEESSRLVRAIESTEEAVVITDTHRRVIFANPALWRLLGLRQDEVIGRDALELATLETSTAILEDTLRGRSWRGESVVRRRDGAAIPVVVNASLIRDFDGVVQGAVAILDDIAEQKRVQAHMQRADRLAAVGSTAAGIAHEVNNALAVILGQTADAATRAPDELRAALMRVDAQAHRIADLMRGVLDFARPRPPRAVAVDVPVLVIRTLELLSRDLERHSVQVQTEFPSALPSAHADPQQLQQVLLNLLGNAIHAVAGVSDARVRIGASRQGDLIALRVVDSGHGIATDDLPRIFDPFYSTKAEGSGLGLSVSYAIARAHGGDLRVDSAPGRGTTFTLELPVAMRRTTAQGPTRALLVDDDADVAQALGAMLSKEGVHTTRAATAAEGLALLDTATWDAVFLDVHLPDLPGPEIYRRLTGSNPALAQRVVFVTGGLRRSGGRLREELPPQPVLIKPCSQEQVREVVRRLRALG
ncbi:MAG: ATP-binding protein [Candidatus Binatia bacterium]